MLQTNGNMFFFFGPAHQDWGTEQPLCTADLRSLMLGYTLGKCPQYALTSKLEVHDGPPPKPTSDISHYLNIFLQWYHHFSCLLSDDQNKITSSFYYLCLLNGRNYLTSNPLCAFITGGLNDLKSLFQSKWAQALWRCHRDFRIVCTVLQFLIFFLLDVVCL